jgi:hypothetical protein
MRIRSVRAYVNSARRAEEEKEQGVSAFENGVVCGDVRPKAMSLNIFHKGECSVHLTQPACVWGERKHLVFHRCYFHENVAGAGECSRVPNERVDDRIELSQGKLFAQEGALQA